jgi:hypothetical protein
MPLDIKNHISENRDVLYKYVRVVDFVKTKKHIYTECWFEDARYVIICNIQGQEAVTIKRSEDASFLDGLEQVFACADLGLPKGTCFSDSILLGFKDACTFKAKLEHYKPLQIRDFKNSAMDKITLNDNPIIKVIHLK